MDQSAGIEFAPEENGMFGPDFMADTKAGR
jgi:hypothetical protein